MVLDNSVYERAAVSRPTLTAIFWVSLFLGPIGFFPADTASQTAHLRGFPRERYWIAFFIAWSFSWLAWGAVLVVLFTGAGVFGVLNSSVPQ